MLVSMQIFSQTTYNSATDGNWNSSFTWSPNGIPGADDTVIIDHDITISGARSCASLSIPFTDPVNTLTITGDSASLTVSGTTSNGGEIIVTGGSAANPATLTCNNTLTNTGVMQINSGQRLVLG